jgi:hypothetical protein
MCARVSCDDIWVQTEGMQSLKPPKIMIIAVRLWLYAGKNMFQQSFATATFVHMKAITEASRVTSWAVILQSEFFASIHGLPCQLHDCSVFRYCTPSAKFPQKAMASEISFHCQDITLFLSSRDEKALVLLPVGARAFCFHPVHSYHPHREHEKRPRR